MNEAPAAGRATQLKRYWIAPDRWDEYMKVWERIAVIRRRCGFDIPFAYADPERKAVSRTGYDPATGAYSIDASRGGPQMVEDYIVKAEIDFVTPVAVP